MAGNSHTQRRRLVGFPLARRGLHTVQRLDGASLPSVDTSDQHYAIAVIATSGIVKVQELRLTYEPGDESQKCFLALVERVCQ